MIDSLLLVGYCMSCGACLYGTSTDVDTKNGTGESVRNKACPVELNPRAYFLRTGVF